MALKPRRADSARVGINLSPLVAAGLFAALIAPALISAWSVPLPFVILFMLAAPIAGFIKFLMLGRRTADIYPLATIFSAALFLVITAGFLHGILTANHATQSLITNAYIFDLLAFISVVGLVIACANSFSSPVAVLVNSLYAATIVLCVLQALLFFAGIENPNAADLPQNMDSAIFLKLLGFNASRSMMPLSSGFQAGALAPLVLCGIAASKVNVLKPRSWIPHLAPFSIGLLLLMIMDVRSFIVAVFVAVLFQARAVPAWLTATFAVVAPTLWVTVAAVGQDVSSLFGSAATRGDTFGMFSGRETIWSKFWAYYAQADLAHILFGNGLFGQVTSGVSLQYAFMFAKWTSASRYSMPLHNSYLQNVIDTGLLGLAIWATLVWVVVHRASQLAKSYRSDAVAFRAAAIVLVSFTFVAGTEVIMSPYLKEAVVVYALLFLAVAIYGGKSAPAASRQSLLPSPAPLAFLAEN